MCLDGKSFLWTGSVDEIPPTWEEGIDLIRVITQAIAVSVLLTTLCTVRVHGGCLEHFFHCGRGVEVIEVIHGMVLKRGGSCLSLPQLYRLRRKGQGGFFVLSENLASGMKIAGG